MGDFLSAKQQRFSQKGFSFMHTVIIVVGGGVPFVSLPPKTEIFSEDLSEDRLFQQGVSQPCHYHLRLLELHVQSVVTSLNYV
jgi:hypothetical protein